MLGAALPPPGDLSSAGEGDDGVEHRGEFVIDAEREKRKRREEFEKHRRSIPSVSERFFFRFCFAVSILSFFSPLFSLSGTLQRKTRALSFPLFYSSIHTPLIIARTAASNLGESIACWIEAGSVEFKELG